MAKENLEREAKLEVGVGFAVPSMIDVWPDVAVVARPEARLAATYLDTADLRLMRAGLTLRHRQERYEDRPTIAEWTLKLPGDAGPKDRSAARGGALVVRRELTWPGGAHSLPTEAAGMVLALRRRAPLLPVARLVTHRRTTELRGAGGSLLAEIDDDVVSVMEGRRLGARFREIEVEIRPEAPDRLLATVLDRLVGAGAVTSDGRSKVVRAIGARATERPDVGRMQLDKDAPLADVIRAAIVEGYLRLVAHDPGVRLDEDPEDVHQARVATRRLRSDLRTFRAVLDPTWLESTRAELGWVAEALGAVRDADVLTERLRDQIGSLPEADGQATGGLLGQLVGEREEARRRLLAAMDSERYVALLDTLATAASCPPWLRLEVPNAANPPDAADPPGAEAIAPEGAEDPVPPLIASDQRASADDHAGVGQLAHPARKVAGRLVVRPWRHLVKAVGELGDEPDDEALHEVRIRAKRLRYGCEAAAVVIGGPAAELGRAAARLQSVLGDFHDAIVAEAWLRQAGLGGSAAEALAAGQLVALERQAADQGRQLWREAWRQLDRKRLRSWLG